MPAPEDDGRIHFPADFCWCCGDWRSCLLHEVQACGCTSSICLTCYQCLAHCTCDGDALMERAVEMAGFNQQYAAEELQARGRALLR